MAQILFILIAFACTLGASCLAIWHIYRHLINYTEPIYQRYTVRIIFMVPVFSTMSFMSLVMSNKSIYYNSVREVYEAWVIYNFLSLCLAWVGGPGVVVTSLSGQSIKPSWFLMTCCLPPMPLDGRFIRRCKQGGLQFVILKPILLVVTFMLYAKGRYRDGNFDTKQGYLYVTIIYTISYSLALYALVLFYVACRDLLQPFKPVPKFVIIKSVVFLTYWQGVLVFLAAKLGIIKSAEEAADVQNFALCVEMAIAAVGHLYAFPYNHYADMNGDASGGLHGSLIHALSFNDVLHDTVHQFAPTYHDYILYSNEGGGTTKYQTRTIISGQEMDVVQNQSHMLGSSIIDDAYPSSVYSSESDSPDSAEGGRKQLKESESTKSMSLFDVPSAFSQSQGVP